MFIKNLAWVGIIAATSTACDTPPDTTADTGSGGNNGLVGTGGSSSTGNPSCDWHDADVSEPDEAPADAGTTDTPVGTCPLIGATTPVYFSTTPGSPCPATAPAIDKPETFLCPRSLLGVRCAYPSPVSTDIEDIWTCSEEGGSLDANGKPIAGSTTTNWETNIEVCKRTGRNCLIGLAEVCGRASQRIELTTRCENRTLLECRYEVGFDGVSKQHALDTTVGVPPECYDLDSGVFYGQTALSVWFNGDCPTSFIVYPSQFADCVKGYLESVRFDCAKGLVCGATGMVGGCAC